MPIDLYHTKSPLNIKNLKSLYEQYAGPVWVYDAEKIYGQIDQLNQFDIVRFAQKACSNIHILRLMRKKNIKVDAVSLGEIERALLAGFLIGKEHNDIIFTADLLDEVTLARIIELEIQVNAGSIDMLVQLGERSIGHKIWLRVNPGFGYGHCQKTNTGGKNSKHGIWYEDLPLALKYIKKYKLELIGLHIHIGSGVNYTHLTKVCDAMVKCVKHLDYDISAISAGGGLSVPYRFGEIPVNINHYFKIWNTAREQIQDHIGHPISLEIEPGRFLVAESGILIAKVRAVKKVANRYFFLVDVGFNDLMRPAMYGSYHYISLLPANNQDIIHEKRYDVIIGGPLCESGDLFTQIEGGKISTRKLPLAKINDYLVFHDTGAYGASMSSNYNSRLLLPEILVEQGTMKQIRRRQCFEDLFLLEMV
ncbi:diaminopimelate decarboxylase [Candidatus Schneideria nysicola]|uniref:diaminopimelate decarboxylase n=1 Tax=Candidatus Schneideria nysicola TaxID=1081631 RepID=UPI001CAA729C|nr:diaminopimelate decarboxylase [Candidatus Schneideria nysicola]UAJ66288.1 diaminopimelate decarboxylase [Candidatus Schneideria nysicola]